MSLTKLSISAGRFLESLVIVEPAQSCIAKCKCHTKNTAKISNITNFGVISKDLSSRCL